MADDVPSPASRRPVQARTPEHEGPSILPWNSALYSAVQALEAQLDACRKENAEHRRTISQLNARLWRARQAHENWLLRRAAWNAERAELLARLKGWE